MAIADLSPKSQGAFGDGYDGIVIRPHVLIDVTGGRTIDFTGFGLNYIRRGHPITKETATGNYKPFPINEAKTALGTLPAGHEYVGLANQSVTKDYPLIGIVRGANVNPNVNAPAVGVFALNSVAVAMKTALPMLDFQKDNF